MKTPAALKASAKLYWDQGWVVVPFKVEDCLKDGKLQKKTSGLLQIWQQFTLEQAKKTRFPAGYNGLALQTGARSGITVVDIYDLGLWKQQLTHHGQVEPDTVKVPTQSGGLHPYFQYKPTIGKKVEDRSRSPHSQQRRMRQHRPDLIHVQWPSPSVHIPPWTFVAQKP
ncbi:hypothetical protein HK102_007377 [Quaeritorhiza haematococci]|nr:hypothetical protein HK102_007377 [Quaeritorhiza haematococci]